MLNFALNLLDEFKNGLKWENRARRALQRWRTLNLNPSVAAFKTIQLNIFPIHFPYILNLTSPSPSVNDGMVHFELTVSIAKLLSSIDLSFDIHIGGCPGVVFNFIVRNSGEGGIKKLTSDSILGAPTTPGTFKKSQKFDYK